MAELNVLLQASLSPDTRKQAESNLTSLSIQPGFLSHLLRLVLDTTEDRAIRLSGGVFLKNTVKAKWEEDDQPLLDLDKSPLRSELVPAMLTLTSPSDKPIRAQIAEAVSLIAAFDFPTKWPDLIHQLVTSLSETDYLINFGVFQTAHSIFRPWRARVRSDELFTEINLVLQTFMPSFLHLFRQTATLLLSQESESLPNHVLLAQCQVLLLEIYYDFSCQDLPPGLEDTHDEFFAPTQGWFQKFLTWDPPGLWGDESFLHGDTDDTDPSVISEIKTRILEIAELFIKLYPDQLQRSSAVEHLVQGVWLLMGSSKIARVTNDTLVSQSLRFISTAIRSGYYKQLFGSGDTISKLIQGVVVPNVGLRDHDMEQFEDDPLEFIRLDLALPSLGFGSSDAATRRQAAADVLQALVSSGYEREATEIVGAWISTGLQEYTSNPLKNWKAKDSAVYLLTAVATRGSTLQHGVTATNALVDVVKFFSDNVYQDLEPSQGTPHPILQADAIRFLHTFRNQLTKPQLLSVLPPLVRHLNSENYVTYTYAAITIERILFIKQDGRLMFTQEDVHEIAPGLLNVLLSKIESAGNAAKIAENEHLIKCVMRVIITARQTFTQGFNEILSRLVNILGVISKNPSNPNFDQYIFESISALMRFVVSGTPSTLSIFEHALFGPFTIILQQDIDQYIPYVFQVLAQMLELHPSDVPPEYHSLLPFLLTPIIWQQKGSIPGLVKLLKAYLTKDGKRMVSTGQLASVLAIIQQHLIPSKLNDGWGYELLHAVLQHVSPDDLRPYFKVLMMTLLTRMQTSKTDKYVYLFALFLMFSMAINVEGLSPDYIIGTVEDIQPQLWSQILANFIVPQIPKFPPKDRKVAVVGLTRMLTQSSFMLREPSVQAWPATFTALVKLFHEPQHLRANVVEDPDVGLTEIDYEEQSAGYQVAYSRLAASELVQVDPVAYVQNPQEFLGQQLTKAGPLVRSLLPMADGMVVQPFLQSLGYV